MAIIDADLIGRQKHSFPNLACMKLSGYHKENGDEVKLLTDYDEDELKQYDQVYLSKVFTDTYVPQKILDLQNITYGGTGFFYDKAEHLPYEIEHHMPDYHLYDECLNWCVESGKSKLSSLKYYTDYSFGFMTRGCFRQCPFCVNQNYTRVQRHSPLEEFYDSSRKKICLLDDNFLGCPNWKEMLLQLQQTGKPFKFVQGLDERLLTDEKCEMLFNSKYDGRVIFAFDNVDDYELIERKLKLIKKYTDKEVKFYVLVGFDRNGRYDTEFWVRDIWDMFRRIELLMMYQAYPYIMRFNMWEQSPYRGVYITTASWCNQPSMFTKKSIMEFASSHNKSDIRYLTKAANDMPDLANKFFNMKYLDFKTNFDI